MILENKLQAKIDTERRERISMMSSKYITMAEQRDKIEKHSGQLKFVLVSYWYIRASLLETTFQSVQVVQVG